MPTSTILFKLARVRKLMGFYGLGSYGTMAALALVFSTVMGVLGTSTYRTRIYTSRDEKVARRAFLGQGGMMFLWSFVTALIGMSAYASVLAGTAFGLVVLLVPAFADWVKLVFGGPAIPATALALAAGVTASLLSRPSAATDAERVAAVMAAREGIVSCGR